MISEIIVEYTVSEAGKWKSWPPSMYNTVPDDAELTRIKNLPITGRRNAASINDMIVHSFRTSNNRRWDCVNGWTSKNEILK